MDSLVTSAELAAPKQSRLSDPHFKGMIKIIFLAYYFPPAGGSGVQRAQKFAKYLPREKFLPIVIAGPSCMKDPWAPKDPSLTASIPSNVTVHSVQDCPTLSQVREKFARWVSLPGPFCEWWTRSAFDLGVKVGTDARLVFATMSPNASAIVASKLSRRLNVPWVADLRDPWALDDIQLYPSLIHRKLEIARMARVLSTASLIIMNTPQAAAVLREKIPRLRATRVISITNGFDREDFRSEVSPRTDAKFRVVHCGGLFTTTGLQVRRRKLYRVLGGVERGVDIITRSPVFLLEAISRWRAAVPSITADLEVVFAGQLTADDRSVIEGSEVRELTRFTGYVSHAESLQLVRTADLLFLPMHNLTPGNRCRSIPGKTYEYMASGRPILAAVPDGDARDFLTQCGMALICRPDDVGSMAEQLDKAYRAWKNGQAIGCMNEEFVEQFERRTLTSQLAEALRDLL